MITDRIKELAAAKAKVVALESSIATELAASLRALPSRFGFADVTGFVAAVRAAVRAAGGKRRGRKPKLGAVTPKTKVTKTRRKRAVITDATRGEVKKLVEAGKTGTAIAKALSISLPSVQNIKKALGLVKPAKPAKK